MKYKYLLITIIVLFLAQVPIRKAIENQPERKEIINANPFNTLPPTDYLGVYLANTVLGGFKPLLVDYLWLKTEQLQKDKQYFSVLSLLTIIAKLQPHMETVWTYNAYNMLYSISNQEKDPQAKWLWTQKGLDYMKEGLSYNPDNPYLTSYLAFFYYHRIHQDRYLMEMVSKAEGKSTYLLAAQWYRKTMEIFEAKGDRGTGYLYEIMALASRYFYAFELLNDKQFDQAIAEINSFNQYIKTVVIPRAGPDYNRWTKELDAYAEIIEIIKSEKAMADDAGSLTGLDAVLSRYADLSNNYLGLEFDPIQRHIDALLSLYLKEAYNCIDRKDIDGAQKVFNILQSQAEKMIPKLDDHPSRWYFLALQQRLKDLEELMITECSDKRQVQKANLKQHYEQYIKKYSKTFGLQEEKSRLNKINGGG